MSDYLRMHSLEFVCDGVCAPALILIDEQLRPSFTYAPFILNEILMFQPLDRIGLIPYQLESEERNLLTGFNQFRSSVCMVIIASKEFHKYVERGHSMCEIKEGLLILNIKRK